MERKPNADPRIAALPDIHGHAKGEHKPFAEERPIPYTARMLFLWFFHACRRNSPRFVMVADHMNYLTFEDPAAVNLVRRALKLAQAGDLYGAAETAGVELGHAAVVSEGLRRGMRYSIGAEIDNDPRCRPDAQNIVDAMKPDGMIRSVHFLPITHPTHGENWMWPFDNPEFKDLYDVVGPDNVWEIYMTTLLDAIDKLPGHIVGHFYVPAKFGHWPADDVLEGYEDRFLAACAERNMAIEVNSRYFYKYFLDDETQRSKYRAVHLRLLRKAKERGVMVAVGSDAHSPKDQGGAFDVVLALLDEAEINEIAFPLGGRLARVALRATAEILREHSAALAAPAERVAARAAAAMHAPVADDDADSDDDDDAAGGEEAPKTAISEAPSAIAEPIEASATVAESANAPATSAPAKKRPPKKVVTIVEAAIPAPHKAKPSEPTDSVATSLATRPAQTTKASSAVEPPSSDTSPTASDPVAIAKPDVAPAPKSTAIAEPATANTASTAVVDPIATPAKAAAAKPVAAKAIAAKAVAVKAVPVKAVAVKRVAAKPVATKSAAAKAVAAKPVAAKSAATKIAPVKSTTAKAAHVKAAETKSAPKSAAPKARTKATSAVAKATAKPARPAAKTAAKPSKVTPAKSIAKKPARSVTLAKKTPPKPVAKKASAKPARAAAKSAPVAKKTAKPISRAAKAKAPVKKVAAKKPAAKKSVRARR
jgi:HisJ family histidinol phosphate phosphatase